MEKIKVYKLSDGSLEESKDKAIKKQEAIDLKKRLNNMRLMFTLEIDQEIISFCRNSDIEPIEIYSPLDEITRDLKKIGYYINAIRYNHNNGIETVTYSAYKD